MGILIPIYVCITRTTFPFKEVDLYSVSDSFANYSYLGSDKMETEQQVIKLRMDSSNGNNHRSLGITFILYRTKQYI